jgi:uncharacterized protein with NRDE domain
MCLLFVVVGTSRHDPLLLAVNREESRSRPCTSPVGVPRGRPRRVLAGADHGPDGSFPEMGTWLGVNETGLAVAVTNRRDGALAWADQIRSRGLLAVTLLAQGDPAEAVRFACDALGAGGYGGSNFLIANREAAFVIHAPGARSVTAQRLGPGVHAMTSGDIDARNDVRVALVHKELDPEQFVPSAQRLCRDRRVVLSGPEYGTVASSLIEVGGAIRFYHVLGNPVESEYLLFHPFLS